MKSPSLVHSEVKITPVSKNWKKRGESVKKIINQLCVCVCSPRFHPFFACVYKHTRNCACMCVEQKVPGLLCAVPAGRGCQNGPISCVSSKIGPNTAETHDTLRLFTALTQCVSGDLPSVRNLSVLRRICSETAGKMRSLAKTHHVMGAGKQSQNDQWKQFYCHLCSV